MDKSMALDFLRAHQPLPPDSDISDEQLQAYRQVFDYFTDHPDPECIDLILNSFGDGSGFGMYVIADDVLRQFPASAVVAALVQSLGSPHRGVRYWSSEIASEYPNAALVEPLSRLLTEDDSSIRRSAIMALEGVPGPDVTTVLRNHLNRETDSTVRDDLVDTLKYRAETGLDTKVLD